VNVHLVDGTFELFRAFYGAPRATGPSGREVGAVRGLTRSLLSLLRQPEVTHVGIAFDHVIESFRNGLFAGYKTGEGVEPDLMAQFGLAEEAAAALGLVVWPMVEFEADDALAAAAHRFAARAEVEQVIVCSPDKDLLQCVEGTRVVAFDRLRRRLTDEDGVRARFGIGPASIPDWLALVGDTSDGIPGVPRFGERTASLLLARYVRLEDIPEDPAAWSVVVRGAAALAQNLRAHREEVRLYRTLATLRRDVPLPEDLDAMRWRGVDEAGLRHLLAVLGDDELAQGMKDGVWLKEPAR
jgi:5'-3' exonuclease